MITNNKSSYRILVVDDIPKNLQVLGSILKGEDYSLEFALDGPAALRWVEKESFDLVLLDIMMPGMSGYDVCKQIRANEKLNDLPIIFLTAKADNESIVDGFKEGGQDYITKPFDSNELLARVATHIELKRAKDVLRNITVVLEQKVEERTQQLLEANLKLQELDQAKTTFLNIISHEIRTPLNGILGSLSLIKSFELGDKTKKFLSLLDISAKRLEKFSYTTLDISLLMTRGQSALRKKPVSLAFLFEASVQRFEDRIKEKGIQLAFDDASPALVVVNENFIAKVNDALLDNAIKFSDEGGDVKVFVRAEADYLSLRIEDRGRGFDDGFVIDHISLFESKEHIDKNPGLNLYLARLIIEAHGGMILASNNASKGAYVEYQLPLN